jgi:hypothetical protein
MKSGSREVFRQAGVPMPEGFERLRDRDGLIGAIVELKRRRPDLRQAVIKLNEGFSGEGNALFSYEGSPANKDLAGGVQGQLAHRIRFESPTETWGRYQQKFMEMGGIVKPRRRRGDTLTVYTVSHQPSERSMYRFDPRQVLGGPSGLGLSGLFFYCRRSILSGYT